MKKKEESERDIEELRERIKERKRIKERVRVKFMLSQLLNVSPPFSLEDRVRRS